MPTPDFIVALRASVGHALLWLSGVTAVVLDNERVLLVRRADTGAWTPVTGIVDPGEHPAVCAVREVLEETGVVAEVERLAWVSVGEPVTYLNGDVAQYLDHTFRCRFVSGEPYVGDDESVQVGWFALSALPPMSPYDAERIAEAASPSSTTRL